MDKNIAASLIDRIMDAGQSLNAGIALIEEITDHDEKVKLRRAIADIMTKMYTDIMHPIVAKYPDLDPDRE